MPQLSILLPTYNGRNFVEQQIASILGQTFEDFELLVADDGSDDGTLDIVGELAKADRRIRILDFDRRNLGQKARLVGLLASARGALIGFSDQDDVWEQQKLSHLIGGLGGAGLAFGPSQLVGAEGQLLGQSLLEALGLPVRPLDRLRALFHPLVSAHAMIVKREIVSDAAFFRLTAFDWLISLDALYSSGVIYTPEAITYHRIHANNQNNGNVQAAKARRDRSSHAKVPRQILPSGDLDRFVLWRRLEHLGMSLVVAPDVRRVFHRLCLLCEQSWFVARSSPLHVTDDALAHALTRELRPFAGSDQDWIECESAIAKMTSSWRTIKSIHITR